MVDQSPLSGNVFQTIQKLQNRSPFLIVVLACVVGTLTGIVGSVFQLAIARIIAWRLDTVTQADATPISHYLLAFLIPALMGFVAYYLVNRYAPESSGSGIPEIEGALLDLRPVRWMRVLPVKFFGGLAALGSGMVLGREGPLVQMGANLGKMVSDFSHYDKQKTQHALVAAGAGAGITAAFNAPLGGIVFVIEEMREEFQFSEASIKAVIAASVCACIAYQMIVGQNPILYLGQAALAPLGSLWICALLGVFLGVVGVVSNQAIISTRKALDRVYAKNRWIFPFTGFFIAGLIGVIALSKPEVTGGGFDIIPDVIAGSYALVPLLAIMLARLVLTVMCFGSGAPGGVFSPTLALGTVAGVSFGLLMAQVLPTHEMPLMTYAILGMAGLFAATIRAPLTGIVIVVEMTGSYALILPLILTCLASTFTAQTLGGSPLYTAMLDNTLAKLGIQRKHDTAS